MQKSREECKHRGGVSGSFPGEKSGLPKSVVVMLHFESFPTAMTFRLTALRRKLT